MPANAPAVLLIQNLNFHYTPGKAVLAAVDLEVSRGERVALVGPSGAGKSTFLLHLNGLLPRTLPVTATAAVITIDGQPLWQQTAGEIRQRVGLVFQDPDDQLFCPTVGEDVAFGPINLKLPLEEIARRVQECLADVGLTGFEDRSTIQLSTGERKRVCLAGVLACKPDIIVLDEPTSNLDPRARNQLVERLDAFAGTQLIATHDLDFVATYCTRVIVLDEGRIQADGDPAGILRKESLMHRHGLEVPLRYRLGSG